MKPSKRLMRAFAKVVLPKTATQSNSVFCLCYVNDKPVRLDDWQTVIELAQKWCKDNYATMACCWNNGIGWDFSVHTKNGFGDGLHKHLPTAIMKAVVAAAKSEGI